MKNGMNALFKGLFKKKILTRILSFILCLVMTFYVIPSVIYAEVAEAFSSEDGAEVTENLDSTKSLLSEDIYSGVLYEVEELREENVKHFHLEDGTYLAAQYLYPVHYMDENGVYQDIDNALAESSGVYANKNARIKFAKKITGNDTLFTLQDGNTKLTLALVGAKKGTLGIAINAGDAEEDTELGKKLNLENLSASVIYKDILSGVDVQYIAESLNIKENIIVKERSDEYSYTFELKLNGLVAELEDSGDILIADEKTGEETYVIPAPVVFDANSNYAPSDKAAYTLTGGGNGKYTLTITVDSDWMNDTSRAYPVTVDPAIVADTSSVLDTYISSSATTTSYGSSTILTVNSSAHAYWKTTVLPSIPSSSYITSAKITLHAGLSFRQPAVSAYEVLTDWNESLTYSQYSSSTSPKGQLGDTVIDYVCISDAGYKTWEIAPLVRKWYSGTNCGVAFKVPSGSMASSSLLSSENATVAYRPSLTISYIDTKGVEDYMSYSSHSAGVAGNGSVNLATGQLTFAIPLMSTTDSLMPYTTSLVYNSALSGVGYVYGNADTANRLDFLGAGFKLNMMQTVIERTYTDTAGNSVKYYVYADADGTEHGFYQSPSDSSIFLDESGKGLTLTPSGTNLVYIDDDNYRYTFGKLTPIPNGASGAFKLYRVTDKVGNVLSLTCGSLSSGGVSLDPADSSVISYQTFRYSDAGKLILIWNYNTNDCVVFRYSTTYAGSLSNTSQNYLRQIDFASGTSAVTATEWLAFAADETANSNITVKAKAEYTYNSAGYLTSAEDSLGNCAIYYTWSNGKVSSVYETEGKTLNNYMGQKLTYTYGERYTDVRSTGADDAPSTDDDIITRYVFDNLCRCISTYSFACSGSEIYGAVVGEYEEQENVKNNLKEKATLGGSATNYLLNGGFEDSSTLNHWTISGNATGRKLSGYVNAGSVVFSPAVNTTASISQYVRLEKGKYTLSFPYEVKNADGITGKVKITSRTGTTVYSEEEISLNPNNLNGIYGEFSTTFEITSATDIKVTVQFTAGASVLSSLSISVDDVALTRSVGSSDFSMVDYGGFETSGINASGTVTANTNGIWTADSTSGTVTTVSTGENIFGNASKVTGNISGKRYIYQRVFEQTSFPDGRSNAGVDYLVSGYAKADSAVLSNSGIFALRVDVTYWQGDGLSDVIVSHYIPFVPDCKGWQFAADVIDTEYEKEEGDNNNYSFVKYIDVYCEYSYQPNGYALFDNISVTSPQYAGYEKYKYHDNGLVKVKENQFYIEWYEYDANRNLTRVANNKGELTDYVYTASEQVSYSVDYTYSHNTAQSALYPINSADPDAEITKTPKTRTDYTYDTNGLMLTSEAYTVDANLAKVSGSKSIYDAYVYETTSGSLIYGAMTKHTDSAGIDTHYFYDNKDGKLLATVNEDGNRGTAYTYDAMDRLISVKPAIYNATSGYTAVTGSQSVAYTYTTDNLISTINTGSTTYTFTYDTFNNPSTVKIGSTTVVSYTYNSNNGKVNKVTYGNGLVVEYVYNELELVKEVWYTYNSTRTQAYGYEYTSDGLVYKFIDYTVGKTTAYRYDGIGRLISYVEYDNNDPSHDFSTEISYNDKGQLWSVYNRLNYTYNTGENYLELGKVYLYSPSGTYSRVATRTPALNGQTTFSYDVFDRLRYKSFQTTNYRNQIGYTYEDVGDYTTGRVDTYTSVINNTQSFVHAFDYDDNGNIVRIIYDTGETIQYTYDILNRLVREINGVLGETIVYTYDNYGNITKKQVTKNGATTTYTYIYTGDKLFKYNNISTYYDQIGNPVHYYNGQTYTFTWTGRQMTGAVYKNKTMSFTYNDNGIRTSKTVAGTKTTYYLDGDRIVAEETNGNVIVYIYDENGLPMGMQYHSATEGANSWYVYWFEKNIFGDVVAVYNQGGIKMASYVYDAWGNATVTYSNGGENMPSKLNPFRYRGYYYDSDLNLYYVNARYYDSVIGRWISPDQMMSGVNGSLNGFNLYAYCFNNPVNMTDHSGNWPKWIEDTANWIEEEYNTWKEESFIYNVFIKNISLDIGMGVGIGAEVTVGPVKVSAISRVDAIGGEINGFDAEIGHHGKSALYAGIGRFSVGVESKTFESFDGTEYDRTQNIPEVGFSVGGEVGAVISLHAGASISISGIVEEFVEYMRKRGWFQ